MSHQRNHRYNDRNRGPRHGGPHDRGSGRNNNNSINYPIVKRALVDYLYSAINVADYRYKIIHDHRDLSNISKDHCVGYNYSGTNCFLVFTRQRGKYYSFLINRSTLSFTRDNLREDEVKVIPIDIRVDNNVYQGTVFDGVLLRYEGHEKKTFVINDVYRLNGTNKQSEQIKHKQMHLRSYLKHMIKEDEQLNNIELVCNEFHPLLHTRSLHHNIESNHRSKDIDGFAFFPNYSGTKVVFLTKHKQPYRKDNPKGKEKQPTKKKNQHDGTDRTVGKISRRDTEQPKSTHPPLRAVFEMRKTDTPDVYDLYLFSINKSKVQSLKRFASAHIPDAECSHLCRDLLDGGNECLVLCQYLDEDEKWVPLKDDVPHNHPDISKNIRKKLKKRADKAN